MASAAPRLPAIANWEQECVKWNEEYAACGTEPRAVAPVSKCLDLWDAGQAPGDEASVSSAQLSGLLGASLLLEDI